MGAVVQAVADVVRKVAKVPSTGPPSESTQGDHIVMTVGAMAVAAVGVAYFGGNATKTDSPILGVALFVACAAAAAAGALIGLLFSLTGDDPGNGSGTQLDKISDWFTKLLIGFGLAQADAIGDAGSDLLASINRDLEVNGSKTIFASAVILFAVAGFLASWFRVRLTLPGALARADLEARLAAQQAAIEQNEDKLADVQTEVDELTEADAAAGEPEADLRAPYREAIAGPFGGRRPGSQFDAVADVGGKRIGIEALRRVRPVTSSVIERNRHRAEVEGLDGVVIVSNVGLTPQARRASTALTGPPLVRVLTVSDTTSPVTSEQIAEALRSVPADGEP